MSAFRSSARSRSLIYKYTQYPCALVQQCGCGRIHSEAMWLRAYSFRTINASIVMYPTTSTIGQRRSESTRIISCEFSRKPRRNSKQTSQQAVWLVPVRHHTFLPLANVLLVKKLLGCALSRARRHDLLRWPKPDDRGFGRYHD